MAQGYQALTEKEKQTLRLVLRGYDAKSLARQLGLSVHTINERLRHSRRKLEVTSSREAARILLDAEGDHYNSHADKSLGADQAAQTMQPEAHGRPRIPFGWIIGGLVIMSLILATLALSMLSQGSVPPVVAQSTSQNAAANVSAQPAITQSALEWLDLVDQGRWSESWDATGQTFKNLNTSDLWASVSEEVRTPLGDVVTRVLTEQERVPAPPNGYVMVKFRTSFENRADVVETLVLERDAGEWRVVTYLIG